MLYLKYQSIWNASSWEEDCLKFDPFCLDFRKIESPFPVMVSKFAMAKVKANNDVWKHANNPKENIFENESNVELHYPTSCLIAKLISMYM